MADVYWRLTQRKDGNVTVMGQVVLPCSHRVYDSARVRDTEKTIEQGKRVVRNLLQVKISDHEGDCKA